MVKRHGFKNVSRVLRELAPGNTGLKAAGRVAPARVRTKHSAHPRRRLSAVEYVGSIDMPPERADVIGRAAEEFEQRVFLPTLGDVRNFYEAYGIEEPKSKSRTSGIPRIFQFLVTMDVADVERMLDDRMFAGPTRLGPIADAIRGRAREYREGIEPELIRSGTRTTGR